MIDAIPTESFRFNVQSDVIGEQDIEAHRERDNDVHREGESTPWGDTTRVFVAQAMNAGWEVMKSRQQDGGLVYRGDVQVFQEGFWGSIDGLFREHQFEESAMRELRQAGDNFMRKIWEVFNAQREQLVSSFAVGSDSEIVAALGIDYDQVLGDAHAQARLRELVEKDNVEGFKVLVSALIHTQSTLEQYREAFRLAGGEPENLCRAVAAQVSAKAEQLRIQIQTDLTRHAFIGSR